MAFAVAESGKRTGDFTLTLLNNRVEVFTQSETGSQQAQVHVGTNQIVLNAGLVFDQMVLDYHLTAAVTDDQDALPVNTTLQGLLPIFGAPEMNTFSPGIVYAPVPEPTAAWLMIAGLAGLGFAARRRSA
jgi:PEP-CTERM motif